MTDLFLAEATSTTTGPSVLAATAWAIALSPATVPVVVIQIVRTWRERGTASLAEPRIDPAAATR